MPRNAVSRLSRAEYLAGSLSRLKPWQAQGMSRMTWYRKGKPSPADTSLAADVTSPVADTGVKADTSLPAKPKTNSFAEPMSQSRLENMLGTLTPLAAEFGWLPDDLAQLESFCNGETVRSLGPEHAVTESAAPMIAHPKQYAMKSNG
jgi:hypothetical protein